LWAKQSTHTGIPYGLVATADSGFILAGYASFTTYDAQLSKFDKQGNLEWSKAYGDSLIDIFYSVGATDDGGLIAAGVTKNDKFFPDNILSGYIVKTDSLGNLEWSRMLGDNLHVSSFNDVHQTMDGGYVAGGEYYDNFFVAKFDENGNICDDCLPADYGSEAPGTGFTDITMGFDSDTGVVEELVYDQYTGGELTVLCLNTGIETVNESLSLTVYPNPSPSGNFEIALPAGISNTTMKVCDVTGKILMIKNSTGGNNIFINLSDRANGIYFLFIEHDNQQFAMKLIK
jgi:Secretion system C-terminal sorting domain